MTKGNTLRKLKEENSKINILPLYIIRWEKYCKNKQSTVASICNEIASDLLIVRSSSKFEDMREQSCAGRFATISNVKKNYNAVINAIEEVFSSYESPIDEEVLIQPMLNDVIRSGVVFTKDNNTGADYCIINYHEGADTSAVTGGSTNDLKTFVVYRKSYERIKEEWIKKLIKACESVEKTLDNTALDIEFAQTNSGEIYILQARPIAGILDEKIFDLSETLNRIYKKVQKLSAPHPFLLGHTTCFGVMPDWNPAEILGVRPKKLAISLYKELITDSIWAHQRKNYGYRDLTMHPLMISFCGVPYIDTRVTFNSFIPAKLNDRIAEKLVNYYIDMLAAYPKYHDKIEFEIVYSCYYLGLPEKLKKLLAYGFNENEIKRIEYALLDLTNRIIDPQNGLYKADIEKIKRLEENYDRIEGADISLIDHIYWLIEECKEYGTLPFAGIARAGFIAVQFLRSFVYTGIISQDECDSYMNSLNTVNRQMNIDLMRYYSGLMNREEFVTAYGHIRPGTYDILSKRYDEAFYEYFPARNGVIDAERDLSGQEFVFSDDQLNRIQQELNENGLLITADDLMNFIRLSVEGRERLKFIFTKSVSRILQLVEELGRRADIGKEDMAHLDISVVKQLYVDLHTGRIDELFAQNIENNKAQYEQARRIKLPSIIVKPEDIYAFYMLEEEPNYVTQKSVVKQGIVLSNRVEDIEDRIVFIRSADPGYDFIFSKNISGLITQFGGANSHMAIRCAELGIPAVIGAGEGRFNEWSKWQIIELDCLKRQVIRIR